MPILTKSPAPGDFPKRISIHPSQRINANSLPKKVVQPARMLVDWVIQPEVPLKSGKPDGTYLQFSTRLAFMEDDVQVRIQLENVQLPDTAVVSIVLTDQDGALDPDDEFAVFTNDTSKFKASSFEVGVFDRPLQKSNDIEAEPFSVTSTKIVFQVDAAKDATFLCTTINLPADPSNTEPDDLEYFVVVFIQAFGKTFRGSSPRLDTHRWWADPGRNLGFRKTDSAITPLIDGDNYFAAVVAAMNAATTRICIASWTLDLTTTIAGVQLFTILLAAAGRGVQVLFLLDLHNGKGNVGNIKGLGSPNIKVRLASHPFNIPSIGTFGSYHEKYVCVDSTQVFAGGIDFEADRRAPVGHAATQNPTAGLPFWHDVGVKAQGVIARDIERDFIRRWNDGDDFDTSTGQLKRPPPAADNLPPPPVAGRTATNHKAQVVKTDTTIVTSPGSVVAPIPSAASVDHLGTLDAFQQAIEHARHFIYMENQYYRDPDIADALVDALNKNTSLQVIIVAPFVSEEELALAGVKQVEEYYIWSGIQQGGPAVEREALKRATLHGMKLQFEFIDKLRKVNGAATRVGVYALAACLNGVATMIYPHAKTAVIDDTWAYIGSANMNGRSLQGVDAEMGVVIHDRSLVTAYRKALFNEHLKLNLETHELREFHRKWQATAVLGKKKIGDVSCADVANVHAIDFLDPPKGQDYNGPLELLFTDNFV